MSNLKVTDLVNGQPKTIKGVEIKLVSVSIETSVIEMKATGNLVVSNTEDLHTLVDLEIEHLNQLLELEKMKQYHYELEQQEYNFGII